MPDLIRHLALVSESQTVGLPALMRVAAALQKQATRDLAPIWNVGATIDAFARLEDVPTDYWPMIVMDDIGYTGAAGIHLDKAGQPFALITSSADQDEWSLTASHETLEILVDPFGNRLVAGDAIVPGQTRVNYLVEVADPSEASQYGYSVNGVWMCDFYTPQFFDPVAAPGVRYSFTGALTQPRQVLPGGYLCWHNPADNHWYRLDRFYGDPNLDDLGVLSASGSIRTQIDKVTEGRHKAAQGGRASVERSVLPFAAVADSSVARAARLHEEIAELLA